jgi:hypothetical protein
MKSELVAPINISNAHDPDQTVWDRALRRRKLNDADHESDDSREGVNLDSRSGVEERRERHRRSEPSAGFIVNR